MSAVYQGIDESFIVVHSTDRLGVAGFEKFLFTILLAFSLFWIFYLRHLAPPPVAREGEPLISIELLRPQADASPPVETVSPEVDERPPAAVPTTAEAPSLPEQQKEKIPAPAEQSLPGQSLPEQSLPEQSHSDQSQASLIEKTLELHREDQGEPKTLADPGTEKFKPNDVFDPRLADRIGGVRQRNHERLQARGNSRSGDTYIDNMGVLNYRSGNTCYQIVEIPGIGYQWYGGECAIIEYEIEFEVNGKKY